MSTPSPSGARAVAQFVCNLRGAGLLPPGSFNAADLREGWQRHAAAFSACMLAGERGLHTSLRAEGGQLYEIHREAQQALARLDAGPPYRFIVGRSVATMHLYGSIGSVPPDEIPAHWVARDINRLGARPVTVNVHSMGGDPHDSLAIYDVLARHRAPVNVFVAGVAGSGASIICMAADTIRMASNALMMMHNPQHCGADERDLIERGVDIYAGRTGQRREVVRDWMADETWLTAQDAVEAGLADEIV